MTVIEVKRYGHISYLVEATPAIVQLYPAMTIYVLATDYDAAQSELAALREELAVIEDECVDHVNLYKAWTKERDDMQQRLTAAEQRNAEREELLLKCMHAFNHVVGFSDQATRTAWYGNFLKPVSGAIMVHLSKTGSNPFGKPTESGASE